MARRFFLSTLGCAKNEVDSAKLAGHLVEGGYEETYSPGLADLLVVNTCAFIDAAREESIEVILDLAARRRPGAKLAVTGCLAERSGAELAANLPEADVVAGFGLDFAAGLEAGASAGSSGAGAPPGGGACAAPPGGSAPVRLLSRDAVPSFDLLELRRPKSSAPWAYVKVAEGCDRRCGFCAIPSFRGRQRSRSLRSILEEVRSLEVREVVLVAQDLASYARDRRRRAGAAASGEAGADIVSLVGEVAKLVDRVRLLYLYPSSLTDRLIDAVAAAGTPYFDLSLQHASGRLLRRMRRYGDTGRFLERIGRIRAVAPEAALRSSFILGYPGETEEDHDELLLFLEEADLDWAGFFKFSPEQGTPAASAPDQVPPELAAARLSECSELQDAITVRRRESLVGSAQTVLVDSPGVARSHREAPDIDGVVLVDRDLAPGSFQHVLITAAIGPDLVGEVASR